MQKHKISLMAVIAALMMICTAVYADSITDLQNRLRSISQNKASSVVFIGTEKIIKQKQMSPFEFFFGIPGQDRGGEQKEREFKQQGLGSGVIYQHKGNDYYIITNNHVVENADKIKISVDQQKFYDGKVMGTDPQVDIAVVKIETKDNLTVAEFGDSDKAQVGDLVIAIGNPFGLTGTMTFGIVSAIGRTGLADDKVNLTNFIQTDAAINPGNSGGSLMNIEGQVIGINSMIYSQSGGNVGIGFAIPSNVAVHTANQIISSGKVQHGYLGVYFQELTEETKEKLDLKNISEGMFVQNVIEGSPAEKAGIQAGDIILEINGKKMRKSSDMTLTVGNAQPGDKMTMKVYRDGKNINVTVTIGTRDNKSFAKNTPDVKGHSYDKYGFELAELTPDIKSKFNIAENSGVVITSVSDRTPASENELQPGDVIVKINNRSIKSLADVDKQLKDKNYDSNYFFISRGGKIMIVMM